MNFFIPDMQLKISQVGLGAFALNNSILRNLLNWRSSFMLIITRETFLPAMNPPCATDIDPVIWTMGQQAGFSRFLDAVCTFSCYKIMFLHWGFATNHVAFCSIFHFCVFLNPKCFMPFTKLAQKTPKKTRPNRKPTLFHSYSLIQLVYFCSVPISPYSWYVLLCILRKQARKLALWG